MKYVIFILAGIFSLVFSINACASDDQHTTPDGLYSLVTEQESEYILVDVRTPGEYKTGHIPSAVNISFDVIADNLPSEDTEARIIVYCRSGRRSGIAAETLSGLGFSNVVDFGSINRWPGELETE